MRDAAALTAPSYASILPHACFAVAARGHGRLALPYLTVKLFLCSDVFQRVPGPNHGNPAEVRDTHDVLHDLALERDLPIEAVAETARLLFGGCIPLLHPLVESI